jgi:hypothetical protein
MGGTHAVQVVKARRLDLEHAHCDVASGAQSISWSPDALSPTDSQGLVVDADRQVAAIDELVDGQHRVVRLNHGLAHLFTSMSHTEEKGKWEEKKNSISLPYVRRWEDGEAREHAVRILLPTMRQLAHTLQGGGAGRTSRSFERSSEPRPAPVPPPREWISWKPCSASHGSACFLRTSCMGRGIRADYSPPRWEPDSP